MPFSYLNGIFNVITLGYLYIKKVDSRILASDRKFFYSKTKCIYSALTIIVGSSANLMNILDFNAQFDITLTFPFYLTYTQIVLQVL